MIQEGIVLLGFEYFFDVTPNHTAPLEKFILGIGKEEFFGYQNGRYIL